MMFSSFLKSLAFMSIASTSVLALETSLKCDQYVKDFTSKEVCVPKKIDKIIITCYGGGSQEIALFMGSDKIVAQPDVQKFQQFLKIYPTLKNVPSAGTFNDVNLENVLKLNPDIVFAGVTSIPTNEKMGQMNIPVFTLGIGKHSIASLLEEFLQVGKILHKEQKAKALISYWHTKLDMIHLRVSQIKPSERQKVFYTNGSSALSSENKKWWGDEFIRASGGVNVASDLAIKGDVSAEILSVWNPDIIITSTNNKSNSSSSALMKNGAFKNLKAIKNNAVYEAPVGAFWWDRPSPESILGILWLSKVLYPKEMKDIDLKRETKEFYKKFYGYTLTDKEYEGFFSNHSKDKK